MSVIKKALILFQRSPDNCGGHFTDITAVLRDFYLFQRLEVFLYTLSSATRANAAFYVDTQPGSAKNGSASGTAHRQHIHLQAPSFVARLTSNSQSTPFLQSRITTNQPFEFRAPSHHFNFSGHDERSGSITIAAGREHGSFTIESHSKVASAPAGASRIDSPTIEPSREVASMTQVEMPLLESVFATDLNPFCSSSSPTSPIIPAPLVDGVANLEMNGSADPFPLGMFDIFDSIANDDLNFYALPEPETIISTTMQHNPETSVADRTNTDAKSTSDNQPVHYYPEIAELVNKTKPGNVAAALTSIRSTWRELQAELNTGYLTSQACRATKRVSRHHPSDGVDRSPAQLRQWRTKMRQIRNRLSAAESRQIMKQKLTTLESVVPRLKELSHYLNAIEEMYPDNKSHT